MSSITPIGITGYPALSEEKDMAMTVEEALQRAADLEKQGCITPTAQALLALARAYQETLADLNGYKGQYDGSC